MNVPNNARNAISHALPLNSYRGVVLCVIAFFSLMFSGCGGEFDGQWPDRSNDYERIVAERCLATMWGVLIDVEKPGGATSVTITSEGEYGTAEGEATVSSKMEVGDVTIELSAEAGKKNFGLKVNSKSFGRIAPSNRLRIAPDKTVFVNSQIREGK